MAQLFPFLDWQQAQLRSLFVQRAEPLQNNTQRPEGASLQSVPECNKLLVGWPTKLTLAPHLADLALAEVRRAEILPTGDRKSTRLNSSHVAISYAVFCLIK